MASLRKRPKSEYWVCCYTTADGRRTQRSTGTTDKDEAMTVCRLWESEARMEREAAEAAVAGGGVPDNTKGRRWIWAAAMVAVLLQLGLFWWWSNRETGPVPLLVEMDSSEAVPEKFSEQQYAKRHRWVRINEEALKAFDEKKWEFTLNLFDDEKHRVDVMAYRKHYHGAKSVVGLVESDLHTSVVLSKRDSRRNVLAGTVALRDGRRFLITHAGEGKHVVIEIDVDVIPGEGNRLREVEPPPVVPEEKREEVGANDHRYGRPKTDLAKAVRTMDSNGLANRLMAAAGINPSNTPYGFYGRGGTASAMGLTQGPTTPARILYQRAGTTEYIDILFVYEENMLATSFNNDVKDLQLKLDNLLEETNLIFKKCLIPLELRQAVLDSANQDPSSGEPIEDSNMLFKATARAWSGGGNSTAATANIDGFDQTIGVIPGTEGPAWKMDTNATKPIYDSIADSATRGLWTTQPVMGVYTPLYEAPNFGGDSDAAMNWITDPRNSLIFGDQYWPEPYINLPEGYQWRLLPVALDSNATYNVDATQSPPPDNVPGRARADFTVMDFASIENPDIFSGPIDSGIYDSASNDKWSQAVNPLQTTFTTSPYGDTGDKAKDMGGTIRAFGNVPIWMPAEKRVYLDEDDGGSLQQTTRGRFTGIYPPHIGLPTTEPGEASAGRDQIRPNYYLFNEDPDDTYATYNSKGAGVEGVISSDLDHFTAKEQTLADGNETSFSDTHGEDAGIVLVMPNTMDWLNFRDRIWARKIGEVSAKVYTLHYTQDSARKTMALVTGFDINATYDTLTKVGHGLNDGQQFESNTTLIPLDRPLYIEKIDDNRTFLRTTSGFSPVGSGSVTTRRINARRSDYGDAINPTQTGIDTFYIPNHGLQTGDQVFITEGRNGDFPAVAAGDAGTASTTVNRKTAYDVYRWDSDNVSLHRIKNRAQSPRLVHFGLYSGADESEERNAMVLESAKSGDIYAVAGGAATFIPPGTPPTFVTHPQDVNSTAGSMVTLIANVHGSAPITYMWQKDGVDLNSTASILSLPYAQDSMSGTYTVIATNSENNATSNGAVVNVTGAGGSAVPGAKVWEYVTGDEVISSPAMDTNGTIYIGSKDKKVYALHGLTGAKIWSHDLNGSANHAPLVDGNGFVYVGGGQKVYALEYRDDVLSGLRLHYPFDGNGTNDAARGGGDQNATLRPNPGGGNAPVRTRDRYDDANEAFQFDGVDDFIRSLDTGGNTGLNYVAHTMGVWVKTSSGSTQGVISSNHGSQYGQIQLKSGAFEAEISQAGGNRKTYITTATVNDGKWHHLAYTYDATSQTLTLYIDGIQQAVTKTNDQDMASFGVNTLFNVGVNKAGAAFFNGTIDDVRVYNRALTDREVRYLSGLGNDSQVSVRWETDLGLKKDGNARTASTSPAIDANGTIYIGADDGELFALNGNTGVKIWNYATSAALSESSPVVDINGTVIFGSTDHYLRALDPTPIISVRQVFPAENLNDDVNSTAAIGADGTIYVGSHDGYLYAYTPAGTRKWRYNVGQPVRSSPRVKHNGTQELIYFGADDGKVYVLTTAGTKVWDFTAGNPVSTRPWVDGNNTVYVTDENSTLHALDYNATSNVVSTRWIFDTNGSATSPIMDENGTIYFGSADGNVYALFPPPGIGNFTDPRDGEVYGTKDIGSQLWMTSNLRYNSGASSFAPDNNAALIPNHGRLYTWAGLTSAIPLGWRLPTDAEWKALEDDLGMPPGDSNLDGNTTAGDRGVTISPTVGAKLMVGGSSGLNFYASGYRDSNGTVRFEHEDNATYLWLGDHNGTATEPWRRKIVKVSQGAGVDTVGSVYRYTQPYANRAESVRLIRNNNVITLWTFATGGPVESDPVLSDDNTTLYIGSDVGKTFALRTAVGATREKWQYNTIGAVKAAVRPSANGSVIYVGANSNKLFALNAATGAKNWEFDTTGPVRTQPVVDGNGTIYFGSDDQKIYAVLSNGTKSWEFRTGEVILSSPVIDTNATLYCGSNDDFLYALDISEAISAPTLKWLFDANGPIHSSPALDPVGNIYFGSRDQNLYALNNNGTLRWSFTTGNFVNSSPVLDSSGVVYFGSDDGKVYALENNGTKRWESAHLGNLVRSSVAVGADGTVFAATLGGKLYALSAPGNGSEIWHYPDSSKSPPDPAMGPVMGSLTIANNGYVIFGSQDDKVYSIFSSAGGLTDSLWPKHRGNRMNMGRMLPIPTIGLISFYPFDSSNANDAILAPGRDGTFSPTTNFVNDRNNKQNSAAQIDYNATGVVGGMQPNIYTSAPDLPDSNSSSVALWVKWGGPKTGAWAGQTAYMFSDVGPGANPSSRAAFAVSVLNNGNLEFHTKTTPTTPDTLTLLSGDNPLTDNDWHHVTVVADRDLDVKRIYIDGVLRAEDISWTDATANAGAGTHGFTIGALGNGGEQELSWNGALDELRIYDRALTPSEVVQIFTSEARTNPTIDPPSVVSQPLDVNSTAGALVGFRVNAVGGFPLTYQWQKDGINISGATDPSYLINNIQGGHGGSYSVSISNGQGSAVSTVTDLNVTGGSQLSANVVSVSSAIRPNLQAPQPGRLWVADGTGADGYYVRRMDANKSIVTLAGGGVRSLADLNGSNTDFNGSATIARFSHIADIATDGGGGPAEDSRVYIAGESNKIFRLDPDGSLHLIAGGGTLDANGTNLAINCKLGNVVSIATDHNGSHIVVADTNATNHYHVFDINTESGVMTRLIGGGVADVDADMSNALNCRVTNIDDVTIDSSGQVYYSDNKRGTVLRLTGTALVRVAGVPAVDPNFRNEVPDGSPSISGRVAAESLAADANGTVYIAGRAWDSIADAYLAGSPFRVRQLIHDANTTIAGAPTQFQPVIKTIAGGGTDDPSSSSTIFATSALLNNVTEVAVDSETNVFIDDVNASTSTVWKVDAVKEGPMPWADGEIIYLVDTNSSDPTAWPALPPYKGYTPSGNMRTAATSLTYHGPYWVNVDENSTKNPRGNRFTLSTSPNGRYINGTWTGYGTSISQPYEVDDSVLIGKGSFSVVTGNSMDILIDNDGDTTCDLVKTSRFDFLTDSNSSINIQHSRQVDFTYRRGDSFLNGANPLIITPGNFDPAFSGVVGVTTNNTIISVGGLRMALNNAAKTSSATSFGGLKTETQRYSIMHDANGSFRFNGDLYETPQRIMDARADLVCLLISGNGGGLGQYYTKTWRGDVAIPDMVENSSTMEDLKRIDHPNVMRNRDTINYSVSQWDGTLPFYVFAAEVAHNLGAGHGIGDRNANVGVPVNPLDYKTTGISQGQDNTTFSPFRNDRISAPEHPAGSGALVKDNYIALGTYFTSKNGTQGKYGTISVYAGLSGGRPAFRTVGLFSTPLVYYEGTNIGYQYGWRIPPPNGNYNEPIKFDNSRAMTTVGTIAAFYRDANGAGRDKPDDVIISQPPKGVISLAHSGKGSPAPAPDPITYAPGVQPFPGTLPSVRAHAAAATKAKAGGLPAITTTPPNPNPGGNSGGLPAVTTPTTPITPNPGTGIGGTTNPAPPTVPGTSGLPNDHQASIWPPAGKRITAPGAVFPARALAVINGTNRGATREQQHDSPLTGGRTVWYRWNAPAQGSGFVRFSTKGSDFDTMIKVMWNDPDPGGKGGYNVQDNARTGPWSEGRYAWKPNQVFLIAVDGVSGAQGTIRISAQIE